MQYYARRTTADIASGSSLLKQEHTVINIGDPDGPPRLVSHETELIPWT